MAELSLTIEDVVHVVETGRVKEHTYIPVRVQHQCQCICTNSIYRNTTRLCFKSNGCREQMLCSVVVVPAVVKLATATISTLKSTLTI